MARPLDSLPSDPKLAQKIATITGELDRLELEQGKLGGIFGSKAHAPVYIAGVVVVACIVFIALLYLLNFEKDVRSDGVKAFIGLLSTALAYMFGRTGAKGD